MAPGKFYHGTSIEAALSIQKDGFDPGRSGSNAGALLGKGVYCTTTLAKALHYANTRPARGIIFELEIDLGRCKTLKPGDPMIKTWQQNGYDSAWAPGGVNHSGLEENCVWDQRRIKILRAIAGDTGALQEEGYGIRNSDGKLAPICDLQSSSAAPCGFLRGVWRVLVVGQDWKKPALCDVGASGNSAAAPARPPAPEAMAPTVRTRPRPRPRSRLRRPLQSSPLAARGNVGAGSASSWS